MRCRVMNTVPIYERYADCYKDPTLMGSPWFVALILSAVVWTLFWKGLGMWHAAKRKESVWFIILLLVNSLGILDMIYIFGIAKVKFDNLFK